MGYLIPKGTHCSIAKDDDRRGWHEYRTTKELTFERTRSNESGALTFERDGYLLLVKSAKVNRIELNYEKGLFDE